MNFFFYVLEWRLKEKLSFLERLRFQRQRCPEKEIMTKYVSLGVRVSSPELQEFQAWCEVVPAC